METGGEFNMRMEGGAEPLAGSVDSGRRSGGFWIVWLDDRPSLRALPGDRRLEPGVSQAVLDALSEAPRVLSEALHLRVPHRPWDRVEVSIGPGTRTEGEALSLGSGCIRLTVGEQTSAADAAGIARHEALHLLLASTLGGAEKWCDPDLAFTDWIVRGIEGRLAPAIPRFRTPLPGLLDPVPASRLEVQRRLASAVEDVEAAQRYFGEALLEGLQRAAQGAGAAAVEHRQLWLVEAALGTYYLEAARRLWAEDADALRPILLDDWLIDYEQYAHGVSNPPAGAGHLWRIPDPGWSRDAVVRLSVAAQALQRDDHCLFSEGCPPHDAVVWKNRGRVRLPLARSEPGPRPAPIHGFRAVLRAMDGADASRATALVEEAARGAEAFEARALWPRILARLLAAKLPLPDLDLPAVPAVQVIDSSAFAAWTEAAERLRAIAGDQGAWVPRVLPPQPAATVGRARRLPASVLLVHGTAPSPDSLFAARQLAARVPVRGALFLGDLGGGAAYERLPDLPDPMDPRYREELWLEGPLAARLEDLPRLADEATRDGRLTTPLSHLLSISAIGLEECHYPRAPAPAPVAGQR
ncbi:MAG TPA: hypothetical protein VIH51_02265 [Myxococcales bacterium]